MVTGVSFVTFGGVQQRLQGVKNCFGVFLFCSIFFCRMSSFRIVLNCTRGIGCGGTINISYSSPFQNSICSSETSPSIKECRKQRYLDIMMKDTKQLAYLTCVGIFMLFLTFHFLTFANTLIENYTEESGLHARAARYHRDVCNDADKLASLHGFDRCAEVQRTISLPPFERAVVKTLGSVLTCGEVCSATAMFVSEKFWIICLSTISLVAFFVWILGDTIWINSRVNKVQLLDNPEPYLRYSDLTPYMNSNFPPALRQRKSLVTGLL